MAREGRIQLERLRNGEPDAVQSASRIARAVVAHDGYWVARDDRDDVIQDVLAQLHRAVTASDFRLSTSVEALVRTIAHRRCVDWMRRRRPEGDEVSELVAGGASPEDRMLVGERLRRVGEAFGMLGYSCRRILGLRIVEGLAYREVAERMRSTEGSIRVRMHRCMTRLRRLVDGDAGGSDSDPVKEG